MAATVSVSLELCHAACCASRAGAGVVSWGRGDLLAFGSCRSIALYAPEVRGPGPLVVTSAPHAVLLRSNSPPPSAT